MRDFENFFRGSRLRWGALERSPHGSSDVAPDDDPAPGPPGPGGRPWLRLIGIAVIMPAVVVVALLVARRSTGSPTAVGGSGLQGQAPAASPPLMSDPPPSTAAVQVAAGTADGAPWSLWVKISPMDLRRPAGSADGATVPSFGPGLDMEVVTPDATGGGGGDPTRMDSLVVATYGPLPGFPSEIVYGVTSLPAKGVQVVLGPSGTVLNATLSSSRRLPGLLFYTAVAPVSAAKEQIAAEAVGSDGAPLARTAPKQALPFAG